MNRHERRKAAKVSEVKIGELDKKFAIQVDGKVGSVVMIYANSEGRKIVVDMWPDVEWSTDDKFSRYHSDEWRFTHIRVTRLPPHLEKAVPLAFASAESLGYAVALALHRRAWPLRVAYWVGEGADIEMGTFGSPPDEGRGADLALYAEYVPASPRPIPVN